MAALRGALNRPPFAPAISSARVGQDGSLWLRREDRGEAFFTWALFDTEGRGLGRVDVPSNVTVHWSRGNVIWASVSDGFGIPWLVRFRLEPMS
jgi:hypothetical protein